MRLFLFIGFFVASLASEAVPRTLPTVDQCSGTDWSWAGFRRYVNGNGEFAILARRSYQAGGMVMATRDEKGQWRAKRVSDHYRHPSYELVVRKDNFKIFRLLNFVNDKGNAGLGALNEINMGLFEQFSELNGGALWIKAVVDEDIEKFNSGYLAVKKVDANIKSIPLSELLTGELTEEGEFDMEQPLFKVGQYFGWGARAQPGLIEVGSKNFRKQFPSSKEIVDPVAIISHEFGHTRFGHPESGADICGEAATVARYENPIRAMRGYQPRKTYHKRDEKLAIDVRSGVIVEAPDPPQNPDKFRRGVPLRRLHPWGRNGLGS